MDGNFSNVVLLDKNEVVGDIFDYTVSIDGVPHTFASSGIDARATACSIALDIALKKLSPDFHFFTVEDPKNSRFLVTAIYKNEAVRHEVIEHVISYKATVLNEMGFE